MASSMDAQVVSFCSGLLGRFPVLDDLALLVVKNDLVKGGILVAILWWLWAQPGPDQARRKEIVVGMMAAALAAAAVSRAIAVLLPFRARPMHSAEFGFPVARALDWDSRHGSFPSDHAALGFAMAAGIFAASPMLGAMAMVYVALAVCVPRVYLGIHWLSDIVGGAGIGVVMAWALTRSSVRSRLARPVLRAFDRFPGLSYAGMFLISVGLLTRFDDIRALAWWTLKVVRGASRPVTG
jgi:membrane-associated phospholipid phosphatase